MSQESERDDELPECTYCQNQLTEEEYEENPTCKRHLDWACRDCLFWGDGDGEWYCVECAKDAEQFLNDGSKQCVCEVCETLVSQDDEQDDPEEDDELENDQDGSTMYIDLGRGYDSHHIILAMILEEMMR